MSDSETPGAPLSDPQPSRSAPPPPPSVPPVPPAPPAVPPYAWGSAYDTENAAQGNPPSAGSSWPTAPQGDAIAVPLGYGQPQGYGSPQGYGPTPGYGAPQGYGPTQVYGAPQGYPAPQGYAPPEGYATPAHGYGPYTPMATIAPRDGGGPALGIIAFVLAVLAAVGATVIGSLAAFAIGQGTGRDIALEPTNVDFDWSILTPVRDAVLAVELAFWTGTILGTWALIQGIVAIVKNRGRGWAIAAVAIAVIGPIAFAIGLQIALATGFGSGAAGS